MKKSTVLTLTSFAVIAMMLIGMASCNKKFDAPPVYIKPDITANTSIMALKTQYGALSANADSLLGDVIITGTVTADDQSGNFFKNIVIQDSTGAISIQISATNLYTNYNIGRQVWIKCKGLYIGNYNNTLTIGAGAGTTSSGKPTMEGIPSTLVSQYVIPGEMLNNIKPTVVTASQLTTNPLDPLQNVLVQLNDYEFAAADTNRTYADPTLVSTSAGTFYPQTCSGTNKTLELYNSNYAYFAGLPVPKGHGSLIGIYAVYGNYKEIEIRDTSDVQFYDTARCNSNGGGGGGGGGGTAITLAQLRAMYTGTDVTLASGTQITGVVISDAANKNISTGNVIIEQNGVGMSVYFGGTITYNIGDSIVITAGSGFKLTSYKGSLEVSTPVGTPKPTPVSTGNVVTPQVLTISQLLAGLAKPLGDPTNIEYTLVQIQNATASSSNGNYSASATISDGTSMTLYTASAATFYGKPLPTGAKTWTGYANNFNTTHELQIRNLNDVQ